MTLHDFGRFSGPHHQALEVLSAKALESGDIAAAYRLADRRCRIRPLAEAHCFVLRAEALDRMGERAAALADLEVAIRIAPDDLAANRRMLAWGGAEQQIAAAKTLIDRERDTGMLRQAIAVLRTSGQTAFAKLQVSGNAVEGWAAWQGAGPIRVTIASETDCVEQFLDADNRHPLSAEHQSAAGFAVPKLPGSEPQFISVMRDNEVLASLRMADDPTPVPVVSSGAAAVGADTPVTVIVPVYADYDATRTCLEGLVRELDKHGRHRAIIVDDASPDRRIQKLIAGLAAQKNLQLLTNARNLGFVGAINRALKEAPSGDIILLNADTIVPAGFIDRLSSAARSSPDIGTVTPFSNNGEFTSFPVPNQPNAVGSDADIERLDRIAEHVNAGGIVDIPNGTGFCLYVTRACLDAVGALSESYHRGYLEDVDFCLRARRHGLRNVCATAVYVGHAGSRSFGKQKRSLVVRNLQVIERRFPAYRAECADFILADPLKAARQAIEAHALPSRPHATLLVARSGPVAEVARERARQLLEGDAPAVLFLEIHYGPGRIVAKLRGAGAAAPQSLEFHLPPSGAAVELLALLRTTQLARIEFLDLARIPRAVVAALLELPVPHDVFIAHAELGLKPRTGPTSVPAPGLGEGPRSGQAVQDSLFWSLVLAGADRVLVPDAQAEAVLSSIAPRRNTVRLQTAGANPVPAPRRSGGAAVRLGLVPVRGGPRDHQFMRGLVAGLRTAQPGIDIVIAGSTFDDDDLLRAGDGFVTGPVGAAELESVFRRYQFDRVVLCLTQPLFGHPIPSAVMASVLPVAYFDWSRGHCPARHGDLPLEPLLPAAGVVTRLMPWLQGRQSP